MSYYSHKLSCNEVGCPSDGMGRRIEVECQSLHLLVQLLQMFFLLSYLLVSSAPESVRIFTEYN